MFVYTSLIHSCLSAPTVQIVSIDHADFSSYSSHSKLLCTMHIDMKGMLASAGKDILKGFGLAFTENSDKMALIHQELRQSPKFLAKKLTV